MQKEQLDTKNIWENLKSDERQVKDFYGWHRDKSHDPFRVLEDEDDEFLFFLEAFDEEVRRLHDEDISDLTTQQLKFFPIVETGTHIGFLRDEDAPNMGDLRTQLSQNILISGAVVSHSKLPLHIGLYSSNNTLKKGMSGGYFQIGQELFPISKGVNNGFLYGSPGVSDAYFNENVLLLAKLKLLEGVLPDILNERLELLVPLLSSEIRESITEVQGMPKEVISKKLELLGGAIEESMCDKELSEEEFKAVNDFCSIRKVYKNHLPNLSSTLFRQLEERKKEIRLDKNLLHPCLTVLDLCSKDMKEKTGIGLEEIDQEFKMYKSVFERKDLSLADQVLLIQEKQINQVFEGTGIQHVSVDVVQVVKKMLLKSFKDKKGFWYRIFSDEKKFSSFQQALSETKSGWTKEHSPFVLVKKDKGTSRLVPILKEKIPSHRPEDLIEGLEKDIIIPSTGLMLLVLQSVGLTMYGGVMQADTLTQISKKFSGFLVDIGENIMKKKVDDSPSHMMMLGLIAVEEEKDRPLKMRKIASQPLNVRKGFMEKIPYMPMKVLARQGDVCLSTYLRSKGYWK